MKISFKDTILTATQTLLEDKLTEYTKDSKTNEEMVDDTLVVDFTFKLIEDLEKQKDFPKES